MNFPTRGNKRTKRTTAWAAPELLKGVDTATREADVFAYGMVVIEVCHRALPHLVLKVDG